MVKFKQARSTVKAPTSAIKTSKVPTTRTALGGIGYTHSAKGELYLLAASNFVGQDLFHEKAAPRDDRFEKLVHTVAVADPEWTLKFVTWLRKGGNMRSASLVAGAEAARALIHAGNTDGWARKLISAPLQRADEPGQMLSYWARYSEVKAGKALKLPKPVKRGIADAVRRLYTEFNFLKWDSSNAPLRFADVIELTHPRPQQGTLSLVGWLSIADIARQHEVDPQHVATQLRRVGSNIEGTLAEGPYIRNLLLDDDEALTFVEEPRNVLESNWKAKTAAKAIGITESALRKALRRPDVERTTSWQGQLFKHIIDERHNRLMMDIPHLRVIQANQDLRRDALIDPKAWLGTARLKAAGMTWEDAMSAVGGKLDKKDVWEAMIPNMGLFALVRNLRNFSDAGISKNFRNLIALKLDDEEAVCRSMMFPFRFLAAYRAAGNDLNWVYPLERALNHSLSNIPALPGRTLILVDQSPSMFPGPYYSGNAADTPKSDICYADQAKTFGAALALRAENACLIQYGIDSERVAFRGGESLLKVMERFRQIDGTDTPSAAQAHFKGHDRVIILTDEQTTTTTSDRFGGGYRRVPADWANRIGIPQSTPIYTVNLAGYKAGHLAGTPNRHWFGGLTDHSFSLIPLLESGADGTWPWLADSPQP